jgi:asparaginyl-tRNA synthetase
MIEFGQSIGARGETLLGEEFTQPFFVMYPPSALEPFPYSRCQPDEVLAIAADLIAPQGYGELLGVAEFEVSRAKVQQRLENSGQWKSEYAWYTELLDYAPAPHAGFGAGVERILRWLLGLDHVRDTFPFPRLYDRHIDQ